MTGTVGKVSSTYAPTAVGRTTYNSKLIRLTHDLSRCSAAVNKTTKSQIFDVNYQQ